MPSRFLRARFGAMGTPALALSWSLSFAVLTIGCGEDDPRDINYGTDVGADYRLPPFTPDAADMAPSDARADGDGSAEVSSDATPADTAEVATGETGPDGTGEAGAPDAGADVVDAPADLGNPQG